MRVEKDFVDFIKCFNVNQVEYLIVGAYAVALHAAPRNTGDIDFWINRSSENAKRVLKALQDFGFSPLEISEDDLTKDESIIQIGYEPVRIDIITSITGVKFEEAFIKKIITKIGNQKAFFISADLLLKNKLATGRKKDIADAEVLSKYIKIQPDK
ncbi:MAG: hypothetical protein M0P61_02085 [Ignavibacteriaceae bacterium]|nr:hypothetical protein [Ignavibacteriaceae bacterium]